MVLIVSLILIVVSILLALRSLRSVQKLEEVGEVKDELKKGKVIFHSDSSLSSEESSSGSA